MDYCSDPFVWDSVCGTEGGAEYPSVDLLFLRVVWCYQIFAAKSLSEESKKVYYCLKRNDMKEARRAVSMIVGRDTET